jgi:hypothetical protein
VRIVALMVVGPNETTRYLDRALRLANTWADEILAVGDRVDLDTRAALTAHHARCQFVDYGAFHESMLRNTALALCDQHLTPGDLVVNLDADEELRTITGSRHITPALERLDGGEAWDVQFWHLWSPDGRYHRVDGAWQPSRGTRIYRHQPGLHLPNRPIAVPPVPPQLQVAPGEPTLAIAHWGYARPHDRDLKHAYYMRVDGGQYHSRAHLESIITEPVLEPVPCPN